MRRVDELREQITDAKGLGKRARDELLSLVELVARDSGDLGAFAAEQATEEVSQIVESTMLIVGERLDANRARLEGVEPEQLAAAVADQLTDGDG